MNGETDGVSLPSGFSTTVDAPDLQIADDTADDYAGDAWNASSSNTLNAWDFGTDSEAPALRYADYDGTGSTYDCAMFPATIPGTTPPTPLVCDTTLLPGQR